MIRINLLPAREVERAVGRRRELSQAGLVAVLLVVLMIALRLWADRSVARSEARLAEVEEALARLRQLTTEVSELDSVSRELEAKLDIIEQLKRKRTGPTRVLVDLSRSTPERLWVEEFTESSGQALLRGYAMDNQTVADFMRQLARSPYFREVDLVESTQSERDGLRLQKFVVKSRINYLGRSEAGVARGSSHGAAGG